MGLQQLQFNYDPQQDRILLRASFTGPEAGLPLQEVRAWLTRRLVRNLWPGIVKALESQVVLDRPQAALAKTEIVGMAHQESVAKFAAGGNFAQPFKQESHGFPIGEAPFLVASAHFTIKGNEPLRINFAPAQGKGIEIGFTQPLLHGFCKLLQDAVAKAQWDIELNIPGAGKDAGVAEGSAAPRVLN